MIINAIIQARMGSSRFPGKVMAEVAGKPLIGHLLDRIKGADVDQTIVAIPTSDWDGPLDRYLAGRGDVYVVSGSEEDVAGRFCKVLEAVPCQAFIRICADSPLLDAHMVTDVADALREGRTFVHYTCGVPGTQVQGVSTDMFLAYVDNMNPDEREHVLSFFTKRRSLAVDCPEDLERIRPILEGKIGLGEWLDQALPA